MDPLDEVDDPAHIITSLDNIVVQLQKHAEQLEALDDALPALQSQRLQQCQQNQVQDVCNYSHIKRSQFELQEEDTLNGRSAKLRWQLYWPAVLCLPRSFYTRGPTQVATGNTVFRHSSPSCTKQELTLQLSLL